MHRRKEKLGPAWTLSHPHHIPLTSWSSCFISFGPNTSSFSSGAPHIQDKVFLALHSYTIYTFCCSAAAAAASVLLSLAARRVSPQAHRTHHALTHSS